MSVEDKIKYFVDQSTIEQEAQTQIYRTAKLPIVMGLRVMSDVHAGKGATVGTVIATKEAICPAAVGVDIGCSVSAYLTNLTANDLPDNLDDIRHEIERCVPTGHHSHKTIVADKYLNDFDDLVSKLKSIHINLDSLDKTLMQVGTMGGSNHFLEVCTDSTNKVWLFIHSGSRNFGLQVANFHIKKAKVLEQNKVLEDPDLAYFMSSDVSMKEYLHDLYVGQQYALANHKVMSKLFEKGLRKFFPSLVVQNPIICSHNYVAEEFYLGEKVYVTRKGATSAKLGEFGLLPGSMGTGSYITKGLGNEDAFCSAPHGAGRRMSRTKARNTFSVDDFKAQTIGVSVKKDSSIIDEIPAAYKDITEVVKQSSKQIEIVDRLTTLMCIKS